MKLLVAEERKSKKGKGGGGGEKTGGGGGFVFEEVKFGRLYDGATDRTAEHEAAAAGARLFGPTAEEAARNAKLKPFLYGGGAMRAEEAARERKRRLAERRVEVELRVNWPKVAGNGRVMLCMFARPPPAVDDEAAAASADAVAAPAAAPVAAAPAPAEEPAARPPLRATNGKAAATEGGKAAAVAALPPTPSEAPAPSDDAAAAAAAATVASILSVKEGSGEVLTMAPGVGLRPFRFERTFDKEASQQAVYEQAARGAVVDLINGVNGCVLVYGQTGAGKTYTMFGEPPEKSDVRLPTRLGVVGRVVAEVLGALDARSPEIQSTLSIAYVEVYGSGVYDLLAGRAGGGQRPSFGPRRLRQRPPVGERGADGGGGGVARRGARPPPRRRRVQAEGGDGDERALEPRAHPLHPHARADAHRHGAGRGDAVEHGVWVRAHLHARRAAAALAALPRRPRWLGAPEEHSDGLQGKGDPDRRRRDLPRQLGPVLCEPWSPHRVGVHQPGAVRAAVTAATATAATTTTTTSTSPPPPPRCSAASRR